MTTITVGSDRKKDVPAPVLLRVWKESWNNDLTNLSNWKDDEEGYDCSCTTDSSVNETRDVVGETLNNWKQQEPNHRHFSIA